MGSIVDKFISELKSQLAEKVTLELSAPPASTSRRRATTRLRRARPLARVIQEDVKTPLGEELLFGKLEKGGHVVIDTEDAEVEDEKTGEKKPGKTRLPLHEQAPGFRHRRMKAPGCPGETSILLIPRDARDRLPVEEAG